jgi:hypothetical protein
MRRTAFLLTITGIMLALVIGSAAIAPDRAAGQDAPTATPFPTNTPRPTATPTATNTPTATTTNTPTDTPTVTPLPTMTPSPTPTIVGPNEYPDNFNPLTGLPYPNETARDRRTLIVKVSNFPEIVRPQTGLQYADLVFEYEVEGAVTRFAAIFRSQGTDKVGSIRSARLIDLELVPMFQALLAYSGANDWIYNYILDSDWRWQALTPQMGANCPPFCRYPDDTKPFEHTLFGNTYEMWDLAESWGVNDGYQFRGFAFSDTPDANGAPAQDIFIDYWNPRQDTRWQYHPDDGRYYRYNNGLPHVDAITGEQLAADNVLVLEAVHVDRPDILDSEVSGVVIETQLWGRGTAWLFRDGLWYEGIWAHAQGRSGMWIVFADGETPMHLKPGQTWINVVRPVMYGVEVQAQPVDMQATAQALYGTATQAAAQTATAIAPFVTPTPITPTPTLEQIP